MESGTRIDQTTGRYKERRQGGETSEWDKSNQQPGDCRARQKATRCLYAFRGARPDRPIELGNTSKTRVKNGNSHLNLF